MTSPHNYVKALMVRWKSDELQVKDDCEALESVLKGKFNYHVESLLLKPPNAHQQLLLKISTLITDFDHVETLFIVHYAGYGLVSPWNGENIWQCKLDDTVNHVNWSTISKEFEKCTGKALLLIDAYCMSKEVPRLPYTDPITVLATRQNKEGRAYVGKDESLTTEKLCKVLKELRQGGAFSLTAEPLGRGPLLDPQSFESSG